MVLPEGIELSTSPLPRGCSTTELRQPTNAIHGFLGVRGTSRKGDGVHMATEC